MKAATKTMAEPRKIIPVPRDIAAIFYKAAFYDCRARINWDVEALHSAG